MGEKHKINAKETYKLLQKYEKDPSSAPRSVIAACRTQRTLAEFVMTENNIVHVALNNLIKWSEIVIEDGGYDRLDEIREKIWKHSKNTVKQTVTPKKSAEITRKESVECWDQSERERLIIERAYFELLAILRHRAMAEPKLRDQLDRHIAKFSLKRYLTVVDGGKNG
jgi:hypothetical protein